MTKPPRVKVYKIRPLGFWAWQCRKCYASGASIYWEIAQLGADRHVEEHLASLRRHLSRDAPTPPGGTRYDWPRPACI